MLSTVKHPPFVTPKSPNKLTPPFVTPTPHLEKSLVKDLFLPAVESEVFGASQYGDDQTGPVGVTQLPVVHQQGQHARDGGGVGETHVLARFAGAGVFINEIHLWVEILGEAGIVRELNGSAMRYFCR